MKKLVIASALSLFMMAMVVPALSAQQPVKTEQTQKKTTNKQAAKKTTAKASQTKKAEAKK